MKLKKDEVAKQLLSRLNYSAYDKSYQCHYAVVMYVLDNFWEDKYDFTELEQESADEFVSAFPTSSKLYDKLIEISKNKTTINRLIDPAAQHTRSADVAFQEALKHFDDYLERTGVICYADKQHFIQKKDLSRLGYSEQQLNGLKEVFKYCPLIKDDGDKYSWVYPTITTGLFTLACKRDLDGDPVKNNNALVRNDKNGKAFYPASVAASKKVKPWNKSVSQSSPVIDDKANIHKKMIGNQSIADYQQSLQNIFDVNILVRQAPNNLEYQPKFINDAVFLQIPQHIALKEALYSDETLKPYVQFEEMPEQKAIGIYIPSDKIPLLHRSITSFLRVATVIPLQQRITELTANSLLSFTVNNEKIQAYDELLEALKNSSLETTTEDIFRQWEKSLNQTEQFNKRTAMVSHRSMFYARDNHLLTSSEKMIRELRKIIAPGSENNKREEIIHMLIHRISKLSQNQAHSEKIVLEKLLQNIQAMPLNSSAQDYCNQIMNWESSACEIEARKTNKVFLQERKKSCGLFASSSYDLLEKIKEELVFKQVQTSWRFF